MMLYTDSSDPIMLVHHALLSDQCLMQHVAVVLSSCNGQAFGAYPSSQKISTQQAERSAWHTLAVKSSPRYSDPVLLAQEPSV